MRAKWMERCGIPDILDDWLDRFYDANEIRALERLASGETAGIDADEAFLARAVRRGIVDRNAGGRVRMADFHTRFETWAMFEGWKDLPDDMRSALNGWELAAYLKEHEADFATVRVGERPPHRVFPE